MSNNFTHNELLSFLQTLLRIYLDLNHLGQVAFFVRREVGRYQTLARDAQVRFASRVLPGFALDPAWLWHDLLPGGAEIYRMVVEMAGEG